MTPGYLYLETHQDRPGLTRLADSEVAAARTLLAETEVRLREAQLELERVGPLHERGVVSKAELDRAQANHDSLEARIVQQREQISVAEGRLALWEQELSDREIRAPFGGVVVAKNAQPGEMISPMSAGGSFTRTGIEITPGEMGDGILPLLFPPEHYFTVKPLVDAGTARRPDSSIHCHALRSL